VETEGAGIVTLVLKENEGEEALGTLNEETDLSLKTRETETKLWNLLPFVE
jgi:hypothetical protein